MIATASALSSLVEVARMGIWQTLGNGTAENGHKSRIPARWLSVFPQLHSTASEGSSCFLAAAIPGFGMAMSGRRNRIPGPELELPLYWLTIPFVTELSCLAAPAAPDF